MGDAAKTARRLAEVLYNIHSTDKISTRCLSVPGAYCDALEWTGNSISSQISRNGGDDPSAATNCGRDCRLTCLLDQAAIKIASRLRHLGGVVAIGHRRLSAATEFGSFLRL